MSKNLRNLIGTLTLGLSLISLSSIISQSLASWRGEEEKSHRPTQIGNATGPDGQQWTGENESNLQKWKNRFCEGPAPIFDPNRQASKKK